MEFNSAFKGLMVKKYISIPSSFLVINICIQEETLCSPCRFSYISWYILHYSSERIRYRITHS